ncbi:hypothetical protein PLICRDRAFT_174460 [Plicaturopsis crispa FD-325 SS-3]|nr:hypothetical protein PLICRDRAFT_174460 [Plicaturopsis crispa FD-325 SS-3]
MPTLNTLPIPLAPPTTRCPRGVHRARSGAPCIDSEVAADTVRLGHLELSFRLRTQRVRVADGACPQRPTLSPPHHVRRTPGDMPGVRRCAGSVRRRRDGPHGYPTPARTKRRRVPASCGTLTPCTRDADAHRRTRNLPSTSADLGGVRVAPLRLPLRNHFTQAHGAAGAYIST